MKSSINLKTVKNENFDLGLGKLQPQALEVEEAILGAIMLDNTALMDVMEVLEPESFYMPAHKHIYDSMRSLFQEDSPVDLLTVKDKLSQAGRLDDVGGIPYLIDLTNKVGSAANIEYHARIVAQKYIQRELIRVSTETIQNSYDVTKDVFDTLDEAEQGLFDVTQNNLTKNYSKLSDVAIKTKKKIEELSTREEGVVGVPSGFTDLDRLTSGWQNSDLIIIAARPGMGKTAFTLALARNAAANHGKGIGFFSLEMSDEQLAQRLISMESQVNSQKLRAGTLHSAEWERLNDVVERFGDVPIFIDDTPAINVFELRAKCRRLVSQQDVKMIMVDYLQLMTGGSSDNGGNRQEEISKISRSLKGLAKELNIPVIALSQLSRAVETRGGDKRPVLSDLRESGAIEQDADIVMFIYRPAYYGQNVEPGDEDLAEIIVSKHRNGETGTISLTYRSDFVDFANRDHSVGIMTSDDFNTSPGGDEYQRYGSKMNEIDNSGGFGKVDFDEENPF